MTPDEIVTRFIERVNGGDLDGAIALWRDDVDMRTFETRAAGG